MGSVIDYIQCPHCGSEAYDDFYYKTGEEYINCQNCGYHRSATIINRDKLLSELTDADWEIKECKDPYGAYRIKFYESVATECGTLVDEMDYRKLMESVVSNEAVEHCSVSRFVDGEIKVEYLVDNSC